jgi:malonyl CoA-acyl carrier protein transacylase/NAD(P)-dependent dehydrogenase (short-subunit alcohol dehydrogenase family)
MGESLYRDEPVFRRMIERCDAVLSGELGVPLTELMFANAGSRLEDTRYGQPALVALQLGLSALWADRGVQPSWVCGHSVGEYAAAVASGVMDVETALKLVVLRARLMSEAPGQGAMLSVAADEQQSIQALGPLADALEVAGCNSPRQTVWSGDVAAVELAVARLQAMGLPAKRLAVSHAFHSRLMEPVLGVFEPAVAASRFGDMTLPFVATGGAVDADVRQPRYWVEQIRQPVRFVQAIRHLHALGARAFIEVGPGATLTSLVRDTLDGDVERIASLQRGVDATLAWHAAAGTWWAAGGVLAAPQRPARSRPGGVELPSYPFERRRHWFTPAAVSAARPASIVQPLVGQRIDLADEGLRVFDARLPAGADWLHDHVVAGRPVMPGAGWISLALQAMASVDRSATLSQLSFDQPLDLDETTRVQTRLVRRDGSWDLRIGKQQADATWVDCARGRWQPRAATATEPLPKPLPGQAIPHEKLYADLATCGLAYGPVFRLLREVGKTDDHVQATVMPPAGSTVDADAPHPAWLDAVFQSVGALLVDDAAEGAAAPVPVAIDALHWHGRALDGDAKALARLRTRDDTGAVVDIGVWDERGQPLMQVEGLRLRWVTALGGRRDNPSYVAEWQPLQAASADGRRWLVVANDDSAARRLAAELTEAGGKAACREGGWQNVQDLTDALRSAWSQHPGTGLLVLLSNGSGNDDVERALQQCEALQATLLACDQLAAECAGLTVCLVTEDALAGPGCAAASIVGAAAAAVWRSAAHELPSLALRHADLSVHRARVDVRVLVQALSGDETELRIHAGAAHVRRLRPAPLAETAVPWPAVDGAVLVTGGTGALGLHVAGGLVEAGARHLVLVSRRAELAPAGAARVQSWRGRGCRVDLIACDVAERDQVRRLIDGLDEQGIPLRGIVHAAGTNDDAPLALLDGARWRGPAQAKVRGAQWLDECTRQLPLAFFVAFSSAAAPLGSPGQCNYAAANAMLEAVLQRRTASRPSGTRAVSLQWGPWAGAGMAASEAVRQALARRGLAALGVAQALEALGQALCGSEAERLVARIDWAALAASSQGTLASAWRAMAPRDGEAIAPPDSERPSPDELLALDKPQALAAIRLELAVQLAQVLKLDSGQLPVQDPPRFDRLRLSSLGLDSLMAMEMRNRMRAWLGVDLPAHVLIGGVEIGEVLDLIHEKALLRSLSQPAPVAGDADTSADDDMEVMVL